MTVIVSDSNNASYDGLLATANGFYRAESYNLGVGSSTSLAVSTPRYLNVTFANAGNCQGIVLGCGATSVSTTAYGVNVVLEQYATVTMPIASPGIVTWTSHGLVGNEPISFTTTGTLPTGITTGVTYYVKYIGVNTFNVSATPGGANINFTGTSSGTHSCGVLRADKELTAADINPEYILGSPTGTSGSNYVDCITPFKFATPYAVDTTASKWRFKITDGTTTGSTSIWSLNTSNATAISYVTWCDTTVTATNGDILIIVDEITINSSFTTGSALGTGEATTGISGWICRSTDISETGIALLNWEISPASSYTFTHDANILTGSWSGFRVGEIANPNPYAQQSFFTRTANASTGSANTAGFKDIQYITTNQIKSKSALLLYGEIPAVPYGELASDAIVGATSIVTTVDLSSTWAVNDVIFVGKQDTQNIGSTTYHTITSFSGGNTINFTPALNTATRKADGTVANKNGYGIRIEGFSSTRSVTMQFDFPCYINVSGCLINGQMGFSGGFSYSYDSSIALPSHRAAYNLSDNFTWRNGENFYQAWSILTIPPEGITMNRNIHVGFKGTQGLLAVYKNTISGIPFYSGTWQYKNNRTLSTSFSSQNINGSLNIKAEIEDNVWENGISTTINASLITLHGNYFTFERNYVWGNGLTGSLGGALALDTSISSRFRDNHYDNNKCAITIVPTAFIIDLILTDELFGSEVANTADIGIYTTGYYDVEFVNPVSTLNLESGSLLADGISVSKVRITNLNSLTNDDSVIAPLGFFQRCGTGLADTTVHTTGVDKFSLRFQPTTSTDLFYWDQKIPTGNIQNLTTAVSIWVKINNAAYYAGTHQNPRLSIDFDNGTVAYAEAADNTDWQLLTVSFSPTTTYGQIIATVSGLTDATGSNAYFYADDVSVFLPPGVQLDLGGMDLWANALPITPSISTNVTATDVWNVPTANLTSPSTTGTKLKKSLETGQFIALN